MSGLAAVIGGLTPRPASTAGMPRSRPSEVRHTVEHAGWDFWSRRRLAGGESEADFHAALRSRRWVSRTGTACNLDALWDCLVTRVTEPTVLLWDGWGPLAHAEPDRFPAVAVASCTTGPSSAPPFTVLMRGAGPEIDAASLDSSQPAVGESHPRSRRTRPRCGSRPASARRRRRARRPSGGPGRRRGAHPGLERLLVAPAGDDEPLLAVVGRLEQLEALESVGVVDRAGPRGEPVGQLVTGVGGHGDGVDLDRGHSPSLPGG